MWYSTYRPLIVFIHYRSHWFFTSHMPARSNAVGWAKCPLHALDFMVVPHCGIGWKLCFKTFLNSSIHAQLNIKYLPLWTGRQTWTWHQAIMWGPPWSQTGLDTNSHQSYGIPISTGLVKRGKSKWSVVKVLALKLQRLTIVVKHSENLFVYMYLETYWSDDVIMS